MNLLVACVVIGAILGFFLGAAVAWEYEAVSIREGVFGGIGGFIGLIIGVVLLR